jgi:putative endonuclease
VPVVHGCAADQSPVSDFSRRDARPDPRRALGRRGEDLAAEHLARLGFAALARNVRTRHGEIDLIVLDGETIVFVEVKTRRVSARSAGGENSVEPLEALRPRQRARLRRLALAWLSDADTSRPRARTLRFDAVGVLLDDRGRLLRLEHLEAAW